MYYSVQNNIISYQHIDGLYDVDKDLVLLVFDSLGPPGDSVGHGGWYLALGYLQFGTFLSNVPAECCRDCQRMYLYTSVCPASASGRCSLL